MAAADQTMNAGNVINLSNKGLNANHLSLLNKGLSFVPQHTDNKFDATVDFFKFTRTIRLREFFHNPTGRNTEITPTAAQPIPGDLPDREEENDSSEPPGPTKTSSFPFKGKSTFVPPSRRNPSIDTFCRLVNSDIERIYRHRKYSARDNLTKGERDALIDLQTDKSIIIKSADKGGGVVVQNTSDYKNEIERQLGDEKYYLKLKGDPTSTFQNQVNQFLEKAANRGTISKNEFDFLYVKSASIPVLYTLPKIHKSINSPPGRPVVAGMNSVTAPLSAFVDHHIKPFVFELPTFLRDSGDVIKSIKDLHIPDSTILCTADVESLYSNIPHVGGLEALTHYLDQSDFDAARKSFFDRSH